MLKKKDTNEVRKLGITAVRDKIVQHAIKRVIEPRLERLFFSNSYAYRPGKGALKAIRRTLAECKKPDLEWVLRIDIDDFFDNIDHDILQNRLTGIGTDPEITRLIMLCVKMGKVKQDSGEWVPCELGVPQGAVLSPLLSNLYLHSFDQFASSCQAAYIRYADDILFLCDSKENAIKILEKTRAFMKERLRLSLNPPTITMISEGFDFLGITIKECIASVSASKQEDIKERISLLDFNEDGFTTKSNKTWEGLTQYYAKLLPQANLESFDECLVKRIIFPLT